MTEVIPTEEMKAGDWASLLGADDLEAILTIATNGQSGRVTPYELRALIAVYRAYEPMREALSKIANCGQSQEPDHWQFRVMARDTSNAALSTLPVNDRQASDDVGRLRALLEEELVWHEERDKSLSKQPPFGEKGWRRAEHQERIDVIRAALKGVPQPATPKESAMTEAQIKHMVDRFLMWKLPEHFNPDGGISFEPFGSKGTPHEYRRDPVGTNLLSAEQATAMVRHMLEGVPQPATRHPEQIGWLVEMNDAGPKYYSFSEHDPDDPWGGFQREAGNATRFARKEDAEAIIAAFAWTPGHVFASEHVWGGEKIEQPASEAGKLSTDEVTS